MAYFKDNAITDSGRLLLAEVQAGGGEFDATRLVVGSGNIPVGKTAATMTAVATPVVSLEITKKERTPDGKAIFGGYFSNKDVTSEFYFREFALYARAIFRDDAGAIIREGDEVLYSYGNAGDTADLIPAYSTSTVVEKNLDLVSWVGNDTQINLEVASGVYVSAEEFESHAARHAKDGADPITPASIGAVPAGFGYGEIMPRIDAASASQSIPEFCQNFDAILDAMTAFPATKQVIVSAPWAYSLGYYLATIYKYSAKYSVVIGVSSPINGSAYGWKIAREDSTWSEVEWINAPMRAGYEYRTTERIDGKAVYKKNANGVIQYRLEGTTEWKNYADVVGAVNKSGDTINGNLNVNGALAVERSDNNRKARTVVHNNTDKEADFQNYTDDNNYVGIRLGTEAMGAGDVAKVVHMENGQFKSHTLLHTGNMEKIFTYGTEDIEAGTASPYPNGTLHFVYE